MTADPVVSPADTRPENAVQRGLREAALAKLRRSTELACGYSDATITRAEAWQLLDERDALLAVGERDKAEIERLRKALDRTEDEWERAWERDGRQIARLTEALERIAARRCGIIYGSRPNGWTCLDQQRDAIENPEGYTHNDRWLNLKAGGHLCAPCRARAVLADEEDAGDG